MPRGALYTQKDIKDIVRMSIEGKTPRQIAAIIRPGASSAWRKIAEIIKEHNNEINNSDVEIVGDRPLLVTMDRKERTRYLQSEFATSQRGQAILNSLMENEKNLFLDEYERVHSELESLTSAEDQMLTTGILSFVLALRAQRAYKEDEQILSDIRNGRALPSQEISKVAGRGEAYRKEYADQMKAYREVMENLKATRDKRLEKIHDQKLTLMDLVTDLNQKDVRQAVIDDVYRLDRMTEQEVARLIKGEEGDPPFQYLVGDMSSLDKSVDLTEDNLQRLKAISNNVPLSQLLNRILNEYFTQKNNNPS